MMARRRPVTWLGIAFSGQLGPISTAPSTPPHYTHMPARNDPQRTLQRRRQAQRRRPAPRPNRTNQTDHLSAHAHQRTPQLGSPPAPGYHHPQERHQTNSKEKANINIASLNVNGASASREGMSCIEKWAAINHMIYNERIAILALQETHLDQTLLDQIIECFGKNLEIMNSPLPANPCASAGVAFIINKALIRPKELTLTEIEPGRAIMIRLKWLESCETSIVNVYVPHDRDAQPDFWAKAMLNRRTLRLPLPDFVLGDFNVTEDSIDRAPAHLDRPRATDAIREVRREWNIQDTWRHTHPDTRCFTYHANVDGEQIQSRLDRIYTAHEISQHVFDWQI